jgi:hypothetical protein
MRYVENYNIEELYTEPEKSSSNEDVNTFLDWLHLSKTEDFSKHYKIKHQINLIDHFIETSPKIQPVKSALNQMPSLQEGLEADLEVKTGMPKANALIVSETLAKIYYEQKKYHLAIETYRKLKQVQPDKGSYFNALIKEIEREMNEGKA